MITLARAGFWLRRHAPWLALVAITLAAALVPFIATRVPLGYLYLDTDVPLHAAGIQRILCGDCFVRDVNFIGDLRPSSERFFFYPLMTWIVRLFSIDVATMSWIMGTLITLMATLGLYWLLVRLTRRPWMSALFSTLGIMGVQLFAGVWYGGMAGGFNTHSLAISFASILFAAFVCVILDERLRPRLLWLFIISALAMNGYPLVFPALLLLMACYVWRYRLMSLRRVVGLLAVCAFLFPIPVWDYWQIMKRSQGQVPFDIRKIMPYLVYSEPTYFLATARRFVALALASFGWGMWLCRKRAAEKQTVSSDGPETVIRRLVGWSGAWTVFFIAIEQLSGTIARFQTSGAMSQFFFASLLGWVLVRITAARARMSRPWFVAGVGVTFLFLVAFSSNIVYTTRIMNDWIRGASALRDRVDVLKNIGSLEPKGALFLTPIGRFATEVRGFAGRGVVLAEKDRGAALLDPARQEALFALIKRLNDPNVFKRPLEAEAIAREQKADYLMIGSTDGLSATPAYRNASWAVVPIK